MSITRIAVLGGTGFVGQRLVAHLAGLGKQIILLTRQRERQRTLMVLPSVRVIETDVYDQKQLTEHFRSCDAVINLVGILNEIGRANFQRAHVELSRIVVQAANQAGVKRLLHMSALNADAQRGVSAYLQSKGKGEDIVHETSKLELQVTSFRPSVIFGPGDSFVNRFAGLLQLAPLAFPLACPNTKFAPIYVDDVVAAMTAALENKNSFGKRLDLCGPKTYSLKQLVEYIAKVSGQDKLVWGLSDRLSRWQATIAERIPGKPFSKDNYLSLQADSICRSNGLDLLGLTATEMESIVPAYLAGKNQRAQLQQFRMLARRDG